MMTNQRSMEAGAFRGGRTRKAHFRRKPGRIALHLPEEMRVRLAYLQYLGSLLQPQHDMAVHVAADAFHGVEVDDRRAMHLPEDRWVQFLHQLLYRLADEALAPG